METVIRVNTTNIIIRKINLNRLRNLAAPIGAGKLSPEAEKEIKDFLEHYQKCRDIELPALQEQTALFILYNCIRGLSWCAMAYTEYKKGRDLQNEDTFQKIKDYLQDPFLTKVEGCCKKLF